MGWNALIEGKGGNDMAKKIAVTIDGNQLVGEFLESQSIRVYSKENEGWKVIEEFPIALDLSKGPGMLRKEITALAEALKDCKILISKKISGLSFTVLDNIGFHLWEIEGSPGDLADYVSNQEESIETQKSEPKKEVAPTALEQLGYYFIDLIQLQQSDAMVSTKQALLPFLRNTPFYQLEIVCSHIPPWFESEFEKLGLNSKIEQTDGNRYKVIVQKKTCI